ncbi:MAG TPA: RidA family protein [Puia sp.]|nr:RidA family protein [Puia sp.]
MPVDDMHPTPNGSSVVHSDYLRSMKKKIIHTGNAPAPIGPYSQAVQAGGMLFISGQIAINPETGELDMTDIETETRRVMKNLQAILQAAGLNFNDVVKTGIFLSDMGHFAKVNEVYGSYFKSDFPARETVAVKTLPKNVNVEISMVALAESLD